MDKMYIAKMMYHKWEEEPISGIGRGYKGTFAVFFYGCNLHCVYCQNYKISHINVRELCRPQADHNEGEGEYNYLQATITPEELADKMIEAEANGAASISFITGVLYRDLIIETIKIAKDKGLSIPIVYNSSGYELAEHIGELGGLVDIYLPDFKYFDNDLGKKYSGVKNYSDIAKFCIEEMYRQVGKYNFESEEDDKKYKGVIVRHLVLPSHTEDSKKILNYLYDQYENNIYYSIMSQYTPMLSNSGIDEFPELKRKLTEREYKKVVDFALDKGIKSAYIQEGEVASESFIPDF